MIMKEYRILLDQSIEFAKENVIQGAQEILEYHQTTILKDGVVRQCAKMLSVMIKDKSIGVAEVLFRDAALEIVSKLTKEQIDGVS
jgi:uncharacterized protein YajQ (UPF0234 family)